SVNRLFFMTSFSPLEAILSSFNWSENSRAGQLQRMNVEPPGDCLRKVDDWHRRHRYRADWRYGHRD
ncbi:hypothetical protein, partial [Burkholderia pseudomallei]|uniref:hypothetical protein n=1 Tax=Burkholderia pseudomallei TaxID=28450 RepID=UPI001C9DAF50